MKCLKHSQRHHDVSKKKIHTTAKKKKSLPQCDRLTQISQTTLEMYRRTEKKS